MNHCFYLLLLLCLCISSCSEETDPTNPINEVTPTLSVRSAITTELENDANITFEIAISPSNYTREISFDFNTVGVTAEPNVDFTASNGTMNIAAGTRTVTVPVTILSDTDKELPETLRFEISNAVNATIGQSFNIGTINDRDEKTRIDQDGYYTNPGHYGYDLFWGDEFDGGAIDESSYSFDLGDGCPDLCGWGNSELEIYTNDTKNVSVQDGRLKITATAEGENTYHSARLTTKDKVSFKYGRIDIRARIPEGQGIWPALWMLGSNIDEVGWPACGEIDIMEAVGNDPFSVHGTTHWGPEGGPNTFKTGTYLGSEKFSSAFHVYTLLWEANQITWYVDEEEYHTFSGTDVGNQPYRFDQEFYFLFNVAVGGIWPGNPDETTVFPQSMDIDYVRVFQLK